MQKLSQNVLCKISRKRAIIAALIVAFAIIALSAMFLYYRLSYVAEIGDHKVTNSEFQYFLFLAHPELDNYVDTKALVWDTSKLKGENVESFLKRTAIDKAKEFYSQLLKANQEIKVDSKFKNYFNKNFDELLKSSGGKDKYLENLKNNNINVSFEDSKSIQRNIFLIQTYINKLIEKVKESDQDIRNKYQQDLSKYQQMTISQVYFRVSKNPDTLDSEFAKAKKKATEVMEKIKSGTSFSDLVLEFSDNETSRKDGGKVVFVRGQMPKEVEEWTFSAMLEMLKL